MNALVPNAALTSGDIYADADSFEHAQRVAKAFKNSTLVPEHLRKNDADALVAFGIARAMGEQPLVVMQNIFFVSGRAGWSTKYKIARANRAGVFRGPIRWRIEGAGDALAVTAYADLAHVEGDARVEVTADMKLAKAEQWTKNAKYQSMPEHMLRWRSASMLIDLYCPDVMLGMPTIEEIETLPPRPGDGARLVSPEVIEQEITSPALASPRPPAKSTDGDAAGSAATPGGAEGQKPPAASPTAPAANDAAPAKRGKKPADDGLFAADAAPEPSELEVQIADMIADIRNPAELEALPKLFGYELEHATPAVRERVKAMIADAAAQL